MDWIGTTLHWYALRVVPQKETGCNCKGAVWHSTDRREEIEAYVSTMSLMSHDRLEHHNKVIKEVWQ